MNDDALCNQSTHSSQIPHFAREQAGYLYGIRGQQALESPAAHTKAEGTSEMKSFPALNTPNINLINYNINLQHVEGGSLEGFSHGQDGSTASWHGNPHNTSHAHAHPHGLQPDLGGLPLTHRHHHQTNEGASTCILRECRSIRFHHL